MGWRAQNAGAKAVIVINDKNNVVTMKYNGKDEITIPVIMVGKSNGNYILDDAEKREPEEDTDDDDTDDDETNLQEYESPEYESPEYEYESPEYEWPMRYLSIGAAGTTGRPTGTPSLAPTGSPIPLSEIPCDSITDDDMCNELNHCEWKKKKGTRKFKCFVKPTETPTMSPVVLPPTEKCKKYKKAGPRNEDDDCEVIKKNGKFRQCVAKDSFAPTASPVAGGEDPTSPIDE